MKTGANNTLRR